MKGGYFMAVFKFSPGKRAQQLVKLIEKYNNDVKLTYSENESGIQFVSKIEAPCIVITRDMISKAYFNGKPEYEASVDKWLDYCALNGNSKVICHTRDKVVICDEDGDKAMSLRFKIYHQMDITRLSDKLGISRNDFVVRAIEHYVQYLNDIEEMEE